MITLFGIKNCDSCKKAIKWLESKGLEFSFHDFKTQGVHTDLINQWLKEIDKHVIINRKSTTYRQLSDEQKLVISDAIGAKEPEYPLQTITSLIADNPLLIKRPVLTYKNHYLVGFSPEQYNTLFVKESSDD